MNDILPPAMRPRAGRIQHMSRLLRQHGATAGQRQSKAYWAPGKTGMD